MLAYQCAAKFGISRPEILDINKSAGKDWLQGFRSRHGISLRTAENTSLARAIGFNRPTVKRFYDNLSDVFIRKSYTQTLSTIWTRQA